MSMCMYCGQMSNSGKKLKAKELEIIRLQSALDEANKIIKGLIFQHCEQVIINGREETFHGWLGANEAAFAYLLKNRLAKQGGTQFRIVFIEDSKDERL